VPIRLFVCVPVRQLVSSAAAIQRHTSDVTTHSVVFCVADYLPGRHDGVRTDGA
jgi:hypothetical protein